MNDLNTKKIINYIRTCAVLILSHICIILSNICDDKHLSIFWAISAVSYFVGSIFIGRKTK